MTICVDKVKSLSLLIWMEDLHVSGSNKTDSVSLVAVTLNQIQFYAFQLSLALVHTMVQLAPSYRQQEKEGRGEGGKREDIQHLDHK